MMGRHAELLPVVGRFFERRADGKLCPKGALVSVLRGAAWLNAANMHLAYRFLPRALAMAGVEPGEAAQLMTFLRANFTPEQFAELAAGPMGGCIGTTSASAKDAADIVGNIGERHVQIEACGCGANLARALTGAPRLAAEHLDRKIAAGVNIGTMWRYFTTSVYASGDLPVIATREALQNSRDARAKHFSVRVDEGNTVVVWDDDGVGMDADTIEHKFLYLGESGKGDAQSSEEATGGFGVAKAVILGLSSGFRWVMESRDNVVTSAGMNDIRFTTGTMRKGTRLIVSGVDPKFSWRWDEARGEDTDLLTRLRDMLSFCDLDVELRCNGAVVAPAFSRRGGSKVTPPRAWPAGVIVNVKSYRRPPGDRRGAYYVRLGGLFQFRRASLRGELKADVVIDLTTRIRPGQPGYPVNAARDAFSESCSWAFDSLMRELEREDEKGDDRKEADVYLPGGDEDEGTNELAALAEQAFGDLDLRTVANEAVQGAADFYRAFAPKPPVDTTTPSKAPPGSPEDEGGEWVEGPTRQPPGLAIVSDGETPSRVLEAVLGAADAAQAVNMGGGVEGGGGILSPQVTTAIARVAQGSATEQDGQAIDAAIEAAEDVAMGPGGGGLAAIVQLAQTRQNLAAVVALPKLKRSPFGKAAALRVTRAHYDRAKARRFRTNYARWMPFLLAWDATLRIISLAAGIRVSFLPGFVLDDTVLGMCVREPRRYRSPQTVIYINPDRMAEALKGHRDRPLAFASYLHHVGVHELTHADGRMGDGHDNRFAVAREDIGVSTAHVLPAIAEICTRLFRMPDSLEARRIRELEQALERTKQGRAGAQAEAKRLARELARMVPGAARPAGATPRQGRRPSATDSRTSATDSASAFDAPEPPVLAPASLLPAIAARLSQMPPDAQRWVRANPLDANVRFYAAYAKSPAPARPSHRDLRAILSDSTTYTRGTLPEAFRWASYAGLVQAVGNATVQISDAGRRELATLDRESGAAPGHVEACGICRGSPALSESCPSCRGTCRESLEKPLAQLSEQEWKERVKRRIAEGQAATVAAGHAELYLLSVVGDIIYVTFGARTGLSEHNNLRNVDNWALEFYAAQALGVPVLALTFDGRDTSAEDLPNGYSVTWDVTVHLNQVEALASRSAEGKRKDAARRTWWARLFAGGARTPGVTISGLEWQGHADRGPNEVVSVELSRPQGFDVSDTRTLGIAAARALGVAPGEVVGIEAGARGTAPFTWWARLTLRRPDVQRA